MFVRVNQADTDMEKAIKLSLKSSDATKDLNIEMNENVSEIQDEASDAQANFPHVGPTVRKKEERKKLRGFDCG